MRNPTTDPQGLLPRIIRVSEPGFADFDLALAKIQFGMHHCRTEGELDQAVNASREKLPVAALTDVESASCRVGQLLIVEAFLLVENRKGFRIQDPHLYVGERCEKAIGRDGLVFRRDGIGPACRMEVVLA